MPQLFGLSCWFDAGRPRRRSTSAAAAAAIAIALSMLAGCAAQAGPVDTTPVTAVIEADGSTRVLLRSLVFEPRDITIPVQTRVDFVWKEEIAHNVIFEDGVKSKIQTKGTYSRTFDAAGFYKYQCTLHPGMRGTIAVEP